MKVIILAGGIGTRLWPLSRERYPKQFIKLKDQNISLFQQTFKRSLLLTEADNIYVVTNQRYKFLVMGAVEELGYVYNENNILTEPQLKNTLPAIYYGVDTIKKEKCGLVVVFPSDHLILEEDKLIKKIELSKTLARDYIVTFGIEPREPNTGYGYILPGEKKHNGYLVKEFKEKPDQEMAINYLSQGYLWNSGIFMFNVDVFISETKKHCQNIFSAFKEYKNIEDIYEKIDKSVSIDYGLMEKSDKVSVVPINIKWDDLGSFESLYRVFEKDEQGNVSDEGNLMIQSKDNIIYSEKNKLVVGLGIEELIVIDSKDALLICKKNRSQEVSKAVNELKKRQDIRVEYNAQDYRPWGYYRILEQNSHCKVKMITIYVNKKLSLQLHHHRSEHWVVVRGMAKVTIDDIEKLIYQGESIYMKAGQKHRLENPGKIPLEIIEVQMGEYLEEDDIIRFDDEYNRGE